jgi:TRAP-type C4-dicarboxylate transport system, small permease component
MKIYVSVVGFLSRCLAVVATALMITAMLVVCQMILMRYVFREPTVWQTDFVVFATTTAMFLGAPYVLMKGGHVGVDVVEMMLAGRRRAVVRLVGSLLGLTFCLVMLVATWIQFHDAYEGGWRHSSVWAPRLAIPLAALPVSFAMLCLQYLAEIAQRVEALVSGRLPPDAAHGVHGAPAPLVTATATPDPAIPAPSGAPAATKESLR